jgi:hypothetical protein
MAAHISDRWLWLGVSVFFFAAVKGIHYALTDLVRLTELDAEQFSPKDREVKKQPEDGEPKTIYAFGQPDLLTPEQP